jgi:cytochrome c553
MIRVSSLFLMAAILFSQCTSPYTSKKNLVAQEAEEVLTVSKEASYSMLSRQCYTCHNPDFPSESRIAPSIAEIKKTYLEHFQDKEEFIKQMVQFVNAPTIEKGKMPEAINQYNLMPVLGFSEKDVAHIAAFLYEASDDVSTWKVGDGQEENITMDPVEVGRQMALSTKSQLGSNLMGAIKSKGTEGALTFCNVAAMPLTDSMSQVHQAVITRVSDKPRNPDNQANETELAHIAYFKAQVSKGQKVVPIVEEQEGQVHFYMPIMTNNMCLQCHGEINTQIQPTTIARLDELYPEDKARGYGPDQVRGIWSIAWQQKTE